MFWFWVCSSCVVRDGWIDQSSIVQRMCEYVCGGTWLVCTSTPAISRVNVRLVVRDSNAIHVFDGSMGGSTESVPACRHCEVEVLTFTALHSRLLRQIHTYIHIYICTYIHTYVRTYIQHTHIHTHIHTSAAAAGGASRATVVHTSYAQARGCCPMVERTRLSFMF
jgi:hypothetical protein